MIHNVLYRVIGW